MPKASKTADKTAEKTTKKTVEKTAEKTAGKGNKTPRTRNYATVVYPESAPKDWQKILAELKVPALVSPLHDSDIDPDGKTKKAHYHVLFMYEGVKTAEQAVEMFDKIGGVGLEIVQSTRGYARYLCHLDNPEKHQYCTDDVKAYCGVDYFAIIGLATDKYKAIKEMMAWCKEFNIYLYSDLLMYAMEERNDWFRVLCDNGTYVMKEYLKSAMFGEKIKKADLEAAMAAEHEKVAWLHDNVKEPFNNQ